MTVHWFLPTGGDTRTLGHSAHGVVEQNPAAIEPVGSRLRHLVSVAKAAESAGFESVLVPTGAHCEDAWTIATAVAAQTERLGFLVAVRPGEVTPPELASRVGTFLRSFGRRLQLNIVVGGNATTSEEKSEKYRRAVEFVREFQRIAQVDQPLPVYLGGSSESAARAGREIADVALVWAEPADALRSRIADIKAGKSGLRVGIRMHVIARETTAEAYRAADALLSDVTPEQVRSRQHALSQLVSEGQQRQRALHGGSADNVHLGPNLWAGIGLVRGGAGLALVGSGAEIRARIAEYREAGVDEFIFSGYPHDEEAQHYARWVGTSPQQGNSGRWPSESGAHLDFSTLSSGQVAV